MDRDELKNKLVGFRAKCAERGRPLSQVCIEEAYPGDSSTSYIVQVSAPWVDDLICSEALDFLFDVLWETTEEETRRSVFSIEIFDSQEQLHCQQPSVERLSEAAQADLQD